MARFIGPKSGGQYDYRTTFDLTNFDPTTASLSGSWAMDNYGTILLNGVDTGNTWGSNSAYGTFVINSGFQSGLNTVDFQVVDDSSGVTGLRAEPVMHFAVLFALICFWRGYIERVSATSPRYSGSAQQAG